MRLFIAIELPQEAVAELRRLQEGLDIFGVRTVKDFHLTLKFLGDVPDNKIEKVKETLRAIRFKPFQVSLAQTGVFPKEGFVKVIWAGMDGEGIIPLQKEIEKGLEKLGWGREKDFVPHLTLARVNFVKDKNALSKKIKSLTVNRISFEVTEFKLIKSDLLPSGPEYTTQDVYKAD